MLLPSTPTTVVANAINPINTIPILPVPADSSSNTMSTHALSKVSFMLYKELTNDLINLLEEDDEHNVIIEAGEPPNTRKFKAHYYMLRMRSPYFKQALSNRWAKQENGVYIFKKPNISPDTFDIILRYIYTSLINVEALNEGEIVNILGAADELCLNKLVEVLQEELIDRKHSWMNKQSVLIYNASQKYPTCTMLSEITQEALYQQPELLLESEDFAALEVETVIWLLKRDDLGMPETDLWKRLVEWGIGQLPVPLDPDVTKWCDRDFMELEEKLRPCIPYIRWKHIAAADFKKQIETYRRLLPPELCELGTDKSLLFNSPLYSQAPSRIQSVLIDPNQAARIASWIDKLDLVTYSSAEEGDAESKTTKFYDPWNIPYHFKLVVRGSRNEKFGQHTLLSNQAVVIIRPENSNELLGGYNPLSWNKKSISPNKEPQNAELLKDSFIFSLGDDVNGKQDIISRVIDAKDSIYCNVYCSPVFGKGDLFPKGHFEIKQPCGCKQTSYEKALRSTSEQFYIEEFEDVIKWMMGLSCETF
ncbi:9092_t:CDS:2 [Acaulospora morrowiae]|uniref:9092_t:CDS:1 n=1 Tax=Acaulospora morrowiae TaxID=94023 RepID=A0A9N9AIC6_9GLOM|nr:9092_t:CDS:2 [Acaulospora morrowiae]